MGLHAYCVWFNGAPLSGKRTVATELARLLEQRGCPTQMVDPDHLRAPGPHGRPRTLLGLEELCEAAAYTAHLLLDHGIIALVPLSIPSARARTKLRVETRRCVEVLVDTPTSVCASRDRSHRLYRSTGGPGPSAYESKEPVHRPPVPDIVVGTAELAPVAAARKVLRELEALAWPVRALGEADAWEDPTRIPRPRESHA